MRNPTSVEEKFALALVRTQGRFASVNARLLDEVENSECRATS
jgi:hypothetical protein